MYGYIYETTNLINNKKYIGKKKSEIFLENKYLGSGIALNAAIKKYGENNFIVKLLDTAESLKELNEKEKFYIEKFNAVISEEYYNIAKGGDGGIIWGSEENHPSKHTDRSGKKNPCYGKHWYTNGEKNIYLKDTEKIPDGFVKGCTRKDLIGRITIYKQKERKNIKKDELDFYKKDGWITSKEKNNILKLNKDIKINKIEEINTQNDLNANKTSNRKNKKLIYKDNVAHYCSIDELQLFLDDGWVQGRPSWYKKFERKKGWHHSEETKNILSNKLKGRKISQESIEKIKNYYLNMTDEEKKIRSENCRKGQLGHKLTNEHKDNISKALKGKVKSKKTCENLSKAQKERFKKLKEIGLNTNWGYDASGTIWVHKYNNDIKECHMIKKEELNDYLSNGFIVGRGKLKK